MVEFKYDPATDRAWLMEINGRFWGSIQLAIAAGVDFPWFYVRQELTGIPPEPVDADPRWRMWWLLGDLDHFLIRLKRGGLRELPRAARDALLAHPGRAPAQPRHAGLGRSAPVPCRTARVGRGGEGGWTMTAATAVRAVPRPAGVPVQSLRELGPCFLYLIVEVARPADWFPAIGLIRLGFFAALWGALAFLVRPGRRPVPKPIWYMLGLCAVMAYHVPMALNNYYAFWGFVNFATLVVGYVLPLATLPRTQESTRVLLNAYVLLHIPTAIHAILYKGTGTGGWMGDENDVALALNVALGVGYYLLPLQRTGFMRLLMIAGMVLDVIGVVMSNSRGGFVGLAALGAYMILAGPKRGRIVSVVVIAAIGLALFAPASYWEEVRSIRTRTSRATPARPGSTSGGLPRRCSGTTRWSVSGRGTTGSAPPNTRTSGGRRRPVSTYGVVPRTRSTTRCSPNRARSASRSSG